MPSRDDPFAGRLAPRLARIERELASAVVDAQVRDWSADRPDRVGFARLGQVLADVSRARGRHRRTWPTTMSPTFFGIIAVLVVGGAGPVILALAAAAGVGIGFAVLAVVRRLRLDAARRARLGVAAIDDPYLYASLRPRLEACAVAARADRSHRRRAAATDLEYALDWLAAAQEQLPR